MALTSEQIDILSSAYVTDIYQELEQEVINDIARRVNKTGRLTETAEIMARNMREQGFNTGEILGEVRKKLNGDPEYIKEVAENTKEYKAMVKELIAEAEAQALAEGNDLMAAAGNMAFNYDMEMWEAHNVNLKADNTLTQLQQAFAKQTAGNLRNITQSSGGLTFGYGSVFDEYQRQMDLATIKVCTGTFSYNQAVKDCVKELSKNGLFVEYPSGRRYNIDSAARMCVRTASSQLSGRITEMNMKKTGQALVYVSAHAGARPTHAVWQGQVYLYDKSKRSEYPQYDDFYAATQYGDINGLKGVNCTHEFYPYWEGDPIPEFKEPDPVTINGKEYSYYEATQEQRRMERNIRQSKRELEALKQVDGADKEIGDLTAKLSKQAQDYKAFSFAAGIRAKTERLGIVTNDSAIQTAIKNRGYSYGKASGVELLGDKLSKRQNSIIKTITEDGKYYKFNKRDISLNDVAAITSATNSEYAMFTKGTERLIIKGNQVGINITFKEIERLAKDGYRWTCHTHPGTSFDTLSPSGADRESLRIFKEYNKQSRSSIYNSAGNFVIFEV